jgi:PAS domain S-box-containing protein
VQTGGPEKVLQQIAELVAVAILYFLVAKGSLLFASVNPSATPIWPPTGLALGLVLLRGYRILPAIFAGALAANLTTAGGFAASLAIALGNTLEALVGAYLINKWAEGRVAFQTPTGIAKFALVVIAASTPVSATIGVTALSLAGTAASADVALIWITWWLGDAAGAIMVCPALVLWADALRGPHAQQEPSLESLVLHAFAAVVGALALGPLLPKESGGHALAFLAVFPLLWAALRRGPRDTSTVALILSAFAVWGVTAEGGPFMQATLNASFLLLVSFIASVTLPSLALSAAVASRERALQRRQEDYRRLVESVRDYAIVMLDAEGNVTTWNAGAARIKHFAEGEILGRHFSCFYTEEDRQAGEPARRLAAAAAGRDESEGWRVRRDGSRFWAEVAISAIRGEHGELIGFAHVTRDVSETHAAQTALKDTRDRLEQAEKLEALGQLTGSVAHDFNNLLTVIAGGLHVLGRSLDPERQRTILGEMQHAVERGTELTRRLLASARRSKANPQPVDLAKLLGGMRGILERTLGPDIRLKLKYEPYLWHVNADAGEIEMALLNLAINARDAMPEGGKVTFTAENISEGEAGGSVRIAVRDTGIGMTPEGRERAFEPFFSTKAPGRGTGLGLSQVQGFAERSGGSVELESEPGKGTTVSIILPKA